MITFNKNASQSGRSMIEMLGVLAIVGILSAGGIAGYSMAMEQYKSNLLIERVQLIATRARTIYKNDYKGISNQNLIDSGKLSATDLQNPFGGNLNVSLVNTKYLYIRTNSNNVPKSACSDILTTDWGNMIESISVGENNSGSVTYQFPAESNTVKSFCNKADRQIRWIFR